MSNLRRFLVCGSRRFNNYYILYRYLKQYLPKGAIIVSGGATGADTLAKIYGELNGHPVEEYLAKWDVFGKSAGMRRNADMAANSDHCIAFWDGISHGTKDMIDRMEKRGAPVTIVDISEDDIIKPHLDCVVHVNHDEFDVYIGRKMYSFEESILANPYRMNANTTRLMVIAMFADKFLKDPKMIRYALTITDKKFGCWCSPELCHGDFLKWCLLTPSVHSELVKLADELEKKSDEHQNVQNKPREYKDQNPEKYIENGEAVPLYSKAKTKLFTGYNDVVYDGWKCYLEIKEKDVVRTNMHRTMKSDYDKPDDEAPRLFYTANDTTKIPIVYQQTDFADSPFKGGYWYVPACLVTRQN